MRAIEPKFKLWLNSGTAQGVFGDGKYRLLRAIEQYGSLQQAARALHISYRKAWGDLQKAQDQLGVKLVEKQRGGSTGGGAKLTADGERWLAAYEQFRADIEQEMTRSFKKHIGKVTRCKAFTLIEVLVAISIIAMLLGILVPSLQRVRGIAGQTLCQNHLRQWAMAFEMYANNNQGYFPHIDGRDRCPNPSPRPEDIADYQYGWVDVLPPYFGEKPWREHERGQFPHGKTIFQCPQAKPAPENMYSYRPRRNGYFSYAMNSCLELDSNCWHHPDDTAWPMPSFLKTTKIENPSQVILLFDQLLDPRKGYDGQMLYRDAGKHCGSYPKSFAARHAKGNSTLGGMILFCDYHVSWRERVWKDDWPGDLEVPPREDKNWYPY